MLSPDVVIVPQDPFAVSISWAILFFWLIFSSFYSLLITLSKTFIVSIVWAGRGLAASLFLEYPPDVEKAKARASF